MSQHCEVNKLQLDHASLIARTAMPSMIALRSFCDTGFAGWRASVSTLAKVLYDPRAERLLLRRGRWPFEQIRDAGARVVRVGLRRRRGFATSGRPPRQGPPGHLVDVAFDGRGQDGRRAAARRRDEGHT